MLLKLLIMPNYKLFVSALETNSQKIVQGILDSLEILNHQEYLDMKS